VDAAARVVVQKLESIRCQCPLNPKFATEVAAQSSELRIRDFARSWGYLDRFQLDEKDRK
jgi:hypothetical protein